MRAGITKILIKPMTEADCQEAIQLVGISMNIEEARWADETMKFYFACSKVGIDSGREYYVWRYGGKICGLVGLHRQIWGPKENVWLSWFAVHPEYRGKGVGSSLIDLITVGTNTTVVPVFLQLSSAYGISQ